jgi:hypothetical protein
MLLLNSYLEKNVNFLALSAQFQGATVTSEGGAYVYSSSFFEGAGSCCCFSCFVGQELASERHELPSRNCS